MELQESRLSMIMLNSNTHKAAFIILILTLLACNQSHDTSVIINDLKNRFPALNSPLKNDQGNYNLIRSVCFGEKSVTIQLYSQSDTLDNTQKIIVLINSQAKQFALPFFSNTINDYWDFQFERSDDQKHQSNTTFEGELNKGLNALNLNDTSGTAGKIISELLYSVLHCEEIKMSDSSRLKGIVLNEIYSVPAENWDSCSQRNLKNWETISMELFPSKDITYKAAYWDKQNARIYQFDYTNFKRRQKNYFKLKTFREGCVAPLMQL